MSFKIFEYQCFNPDCLEYEEIDERLVSPYEDTQVCKSCNKELTKILSVTRGYVDKPSSGHPCKQ